MYSIEEDAFEGSDLLVYLAWIYTLVDEYEAAFQELDKLLAIPSELSVPLLRIDPRWDPLRDHPRFQALMEKYG
jgi:serine/threonine-protein kinase